MIPHCYDDDAGREASKLIPKGLCAALALAILATALSGCNDRSTEAKPPAFVRTEVVRAGPLQHSVTLTGEVWARFRADLSFRVSGRVVERLVEVGAHVNAGDLLARLEPTEQHADVDAAESAVTAADAQLRVARATFHRQNELLSNGFTTRVLFDQAQETLRRAEASLDAAKAQLGTAKDALSYTELHAGAAGIITARNVEVGQVVQAAQSVFTLAQDGERDAIFDVNESLLLDEPAGSLVALALVSDPHVTAIGRVREISPVSDPKTGTVRVKVGIENPPAAMTLGAAVSGTAKWKPVVQISLPWTALMALGSKPAVWVIDPKSKRASLKPVTIGEYDASSVVFQGGLEPGDRVVVDGGKLLSSGELVDYEETGS